MIAQWVWLSMSNNNPQGVPTQEQYNRYRQRLNELLLQGVPVREAEQQALEYAMETDS